MHMLIKHPMVIALDDNCSGPRTMEKKKKTNPCWLWFVCSRLQIFLLTRRLKTLLPLGICCQPPLCLTVYCRRNKDEDAPATVSTGNVSSLPLSATGLHGIWSKSYWEALITLMFSWLLHWTLEVCLWVLKKCFHKPRTLSEQLRQRETFSRLILVSHKWASENHHDNGL